MHAANPHVHNLAACQVPSQLGTLLMLGRSLLRLGRCQAQH